MNISILCPTRERPAHAAAMIDSAFKLAKEPSRVEVRILVDHDDADLALYRQMTSHNVFLTVQEPRLSNPAAMNRLATEMALGDVLLTGSDDVIFRTYAWDETLERTLARHPDGLALAYFNDGRNRDKVEHFAVPRRWVETVGYFLHPEYEHFCADEHQERIARAVDRCIYLRDVVLEHMHVKYGKAQPDATYRRTRSPGPDGRSMSQRDNERLLLHSHCEIPAAVKRVQAAIDAYRARAA